ncbi:MAG: hypothetical protein GX087_11255 [Desulfobulbaceae bacterium]|nr:hypothetical protein [Desulfobulbaceae bacterium]
MLRFKLIGGLGWPGIIGDAKTLERAEPWTVGIGKSELDVPERTVTSRLSCRLTISLIWNWNTS